MKPEQKRFFHGEIYSHYCDVRMGAVAYQITSLTIVYSIVYSDADQRKHQSSASLAFVPRDRWIPRTNGQLHGKCFHLMTSSCVISSSLRAGLLAWEVNSWLKHIRSLIPMGLFIYSFISFITDIFEATAVAQAIVSIWHTVRFITIPSVIRVNHASKLYPLSKQ